MCHYGGERIPSSLLATMTKRAAPLKAHRQQARDVGDLAACELVGPPEAAVGLGRVTAGGGVRTYSPWVALLMGLCSYASISPQVQSRPCPCWSLDCGACTVT